LCFSPIDETTCTVINGEKWDTCHDCEKKDKNQYREVLHLLRKENQLLRLEVLDLKQRLEGLE